MVKVTIDNKTIHVEEGTTILEAAKSIGIDIPTLCYLKDINELASCRICLVEVEGCSKLCASCNTVVTDNMVVHTNTKRVLDARKINLQLILSQHRDSCPTCVRSGNCTLQQLASDFNITEIPFPASYKNAEFDKNSVLIRDDSKCVKCMRCVTVCEKVQGIGVWALTGTGAHTTVGTVNGLTLNEAGCALCGQCIVNCPVGALSAKDDTQKVLDAIHDPDIVTVVQVAPAVRTAWGEGIGLEKSEASVKKLVGVLKEMGFDYVFDTDFSADLTIMEEASELVERIVSGEEYEYPLFTSCCPGWVRFMKTQYPELIGNLSTSKSPQQMFGAIVKSYFAQKINVAPEKIFCVSVMPCTAKKYEASVKEINSGECRDVDAVITTREFERLIKVCRIKAENVAQTEFDKPLGISTGAGVIFGVTGGVTEAALRSAVYFATGKNADCDAFSFVRGYDGIRQAELELNGKTVKIAIVHGLKNAHKVIEDIKAKKIHFDFVEVMACPGGCSGGGGQPIKDGEKCFIERGNGLYTLDKNEHTIRRSHENPAIIELYDTYLEKPLSETAHHLLHTHQQDWSL